MVDLAHLTIEQTWACLQSVPDPEIPVISVTDLGIVRDVSVDGYDAHITVTPTYSGCPATEMIEQSIREALMQLGFKNIQIQMQLSPAWTTDWITQDAKERLRQYGIAPPSGERAHTQEGQVINFVPYKPACPRCGSKKTSRLSQFGATACKALYRCDSCLEPFEYFKPI